MPVTASIIKRLSELRVSTEVMSEILLILSEVAAEEQQQRTAEAMRTARYRARGGGKIPEAMRAEVFERDNYECVYCGGIEHLQCDHVVPVSKGGETTIDNLATACRVCNARKKDRERKAFAHSAEIPWKEMDKSGNKSGNSAEPPPLKKDIKPPVSSLRSDISYANAYSSETSSDTLASETPKRRKRVSYPPDFEAFWTAFPTDALMSKKAAGLVWSRMSEDVRQLAMASLPTFRAYCTSKPDYRPVHAVRYLTQERFVGFSEVVSKAAGKVFVAKGTPQWTAWQRVQHSSCVTSAEHRQDGWWFESEWPNGEHSDERKTA